MLSSLPAAAIAVLSLTAAAIADSVPLEARKAAAPSGLPTVDLGYQIQQANAFNQTGNYYNFSNIRYAAPPVGHLRFREPQPPAKLNGSRTENGTVGRVCPQANPAWALTAAQFIVQYAQGKTNFTPADFNVSLNSPAGDLILQQDPRTTEDCLFLDVIVPQHIFEKREKSKAPVLVWIYGGGYTAGSKTDSGNPAGLLLRSQNNATNGTGVVYVAMNYRLGAFGWLSGSSIQENGTANAGLYDQRFALQWVQKHIHKFGGDPKRVTVVGESAGGGSIMHQITAFGGAKGAAPFQQAVIQSPGFVPTVSTAQQEQTFQSYLTLLNASSLEQARSLPYKSLQLANVIQVGLSPYGTFTYGPVVDGVFAPSLPGQLLARGQFDKALRKVMVAHNADEGLLFTSPYSQNSSAITQQLLGLLPSAAAFPKVLSYITDVLYPPIFDGSQAEGYTNNIQRAAAIVAESSFVCNTFYLDKAFNNQTYAYLFAIPPATHGQDVSYTFYNGPDPKNVVSPQIAILMQEYITHFAETGNPNQKGVPYFSQYGNNATVQVLNITGIRQARDDVANRRCNWWQQALYY